MKGHFWLTLTILWVGYLGARKLYRSTDSDYTKKEASVIIDIDKIKEDGAIKNGAHLMRTYHLIYFNDFVDVESPIFNSILLDFYKKNKTKYDFDIIYLTLIRKGADTRKRNTAVKRMPWIVISPHSHFYKYIIDTIAPKKCPFLVLLDNKGKVIESSVSNGHYVNPDVVLNRLRGVALNRGKSEFALSEVGKVLSARKQNEKIVDDMLNMVQHKHKKKKVVKPQVVPAEKQTEISLKEDEQQKEAKKLFKLNGVVTLAGKKGAVINGNITHKGDKLMDEAILKEIDDQWVIINYKGVDVKVTIY
jgi:hypothetical protein